MNAIFPISISALRVAYNDSNVVTNNFQGIITPFDKLPYSSSLGGNSTGDTIFTPLTASSGGTLENHLETGIHLHWQLPEFFKKGQLQDGNNTVKFPQAPNRWLVTRFLSLYDPVTQTYNLTSRVWVVESDYITSSPLDNSNYPRPGVPVPIPQTTADSSGCIPPFSYMGRVVNSEDWPATATNAGYLSNYTDANGEPCYLSAVGFTGPHFSSYYPECRSVFGFWDSFDDTDPGSDGYKVGQAINQTGNAAAPFQIDFKVSYQVLGWIDGGSDPMSILSAKSINSYNNYITRCNAKSITPDPKYSPGYFFGKEAKDCKSYFNQADLSFTLNPDNTIATTDFPVQSICSGLIQEIIWSSDNETNFLGVDVPTNNTPVTFGNQIALPEVTVSIGNSQAEAVSAILRSNLPAGAQPGSEELYEFLINGLQLGLLNGIEQMPNVLTMLEETLHQNGFSASSSGGLWIIDVPPGKKKNGKDNSEITLPPEFAGALNTLNVAQKAYDTARNQLLTMRMQLFMDWYRYIELFNYNNDHTSTEPQVENYLYTENQNNANTYNSLLSALVTQLQTFIANALTEIQTGTINTGVLSFAPGPVVMDPPVYSDFNPATPPVASELANAVFNAYTNLASLLANNANKLAYKILQVPAPPFYLPEEPVLALESDLFTQLTNNKKNKKTFVRLDTEIITELSITSPYNAAGISVNVSDISSSLPTLSTQLPNCQVLQALIGEGVLMNPMMASPVCNVLISRLAPGTLTTEQAADLQTALMYANGGVSPIDPLFSASLNAMNSLFTLVNSKKHLKPDSVVEVAEPVALSVTYTNATRNGWVTDAKGWSTQQTYAFTMAGASGTGFYQDPAITRNDPFNPLFLVWEVAVSPLSSNGQDANYSADTITRDFIFDDDTIDYCYLLNGGNSPKPFDVSDPHMPVYSNFTLISPTTTGVLVNKIEKYIQDHPGEARELQPVIEAMNNKYICSFPLNGFNTKQVLNDVIGKVQVQNLTVGIYDNSPTENIANAATASTTDNWYASGFNSLMPVYDDPGMFNFGPVRSGILQVQNIQVVDTFGQYLTIPKPTCAAANSLSLDPGDTASPANSVFLPPRVLAPSRLWFRWLSAAVSNNPASPYVEMNSTPATSPVCGWIVPNNLDGNLFFYDADGSPIGYVQVVGTEVSYFTNPLNLENNPPPGNVALDIKNVNPCMGSFLQYVLGQSVAFFTDFLAAIQSSEQYLEPANFRQHAGLSLLIGRPLALVRAVIGLETAGGTLPISQLDTSSKTSFYTDVTNNNSTYSQRMASSSANLGNVEFPVVLGSLSNLDDGLVGFVIEEGGIDGANPYADKQAFYSVASQATTPGSNVKNSTSSVLQLTLNAAEPAVITVLVDPRASVHATTGILPVSTLSIPASQYSDAMNSLEVSFVARPLLQTRQGLSFPLPAENGYSWSFINENGDGTITNTPIQPGAIQAQPMSGYSPQSILEGWLSLTENPENPHT